MDNKDIFGQWLLDNENSPEVDTVMRKIYDSSASGDPRLSREGYEAFAAKVGLKRETSIHRVGRVLTRVAAVFSIPLLLLSVWALYRMSLPEPEWKQVTTTYAQRAQVILPDGTEVILSPCSQLYYPEKFTKKQRKVLLSGEAFLDVSKDENKKFVVTAGDMDVVVHGTRFNVSSYPTGEEYEVALVEGSVEMMFHGGGSIVLSPGELVKYDRSRKVAQRMQFAPNYFEEVIKSGGLQFRNMPLSEIVAVLNRQFNINIIIKDPVLAGERYFASFINGEGPEQILSALNTNNHFCVKQQDDYYYITK